MKAKIWVECDRRGYYAAVVLAAFPEGCAAPVVRAQRRGCSGVEESRLTAAGWVEALKRQPEVERWERLGEVFTVARYGDLEWLWVRGSDGRLSRSLAEIRKQCAGVRVEERG